MAAPSGGGGASSGRSRLGNYALIDHEGRVQGYASMRRLMACMPVARLGE